ncbi:MAG: Hsp20/alpha crystallin family protein [Erysipelotrichaceae bacterium]|nr:Hsp20/alpha crystallin family protein [Erysipelotrichaceae bacterium]MBQ1315331.1 Hsp20/alpha crystallin family protein [Erysipelotrichaceae bacterium]MBQ2214642.1 Hsp20/alpha crystallin family protein [Erysipelotrichaceae bacterium]MBR2792670.1 Hsp20/alpha crystallin family protein [Erysipelotrichaceae bacterium]MBR3350665.1 Hsp20/alpha crystallin family protein [Erysipelotrichaceae bacterium]
MLTPRIFTENLFDDLFEDFPFRSLENVDRKLYGKHAGREMLTDVKEHENHYAVEIDLPGFKKDEIKLELNEGYLTITASKGVDEEEKNKQGRIVRQERYSGVMQRTYYVGEQIKAEDIKARYEDGVLKLEIPKVEEKKLPEEHTIMIEG